MYTNTRLGILYLNKYYYVNFSVHPILIQYILIQYRLILIQYIYTKLNIVPANTYTAPDTMHTYTYIV